MQYALINLTNEEQRKLLLDYAVQIGIEVNLLEIDSIEDYALGLKMEKEKTGELVDRDLVMKALENKYNETKNIDKLLAIGYAATSKEDIEIAEEFDLSL